MYFIASGHIVDCIKFICVIHTDVVLSCAPEVIGMYGIYGHICYWHMIWQ